MDADGETIQDWLEQLDMVATVCHWDQPTKLVNLVTRLRGQAFAFYRTCTPEQRGSYKALKAELLMRFTPVRIQSVETSLFHEHKQRNKEPVDDYAQGLKQLFNRVYPRSDQGT